MKLITYTNAKSQLLSLQKYINLVDQYDDKSSIEAWIIKNFAVTNSISKIIKESNEVDFPFDKSLINREYIKNVLLADNKNTDELQEILKKSYINRYLKKP